MKRSVHFGMNSVSEAAYGGWNGALAGCWNDADDMGGVFAGLGYDARGFMDAECTLSKLRQEFADAAAACVAGDYFLFSDSGHGSTKATFLGATESICLYDGLLADTELRAMLAAFKPGVKLIVILDTCFSGGMARAVPLSRPRVAPLHVTARMPVTQFRSDVPIVADGVLISAARADETAGDGDKNGAFTGSFLEVMEEGQTLQSWMDATARYMSRNFPQQHPVLTNLNGSLAGELV